MEVYDRPAIGKVIDDIEVRMTYIPIWIAIQALRSGDSRSIYVTRKSERQFL